MSLLQPMLRYLSAQCGVDNPADKRFLLAVSGGRDSVAMTHLFAEAGLSFGIGHCNFRLRAAESDADAELVKQLAASLRQPFYEVSFATQQVAQERSVSIQMAARALRYEWLEEVRVQEGYHYIATAHHLTDSVETLIHHLARGSGLNGLLGIPPRNGKVVRPLLFAAGAALENYVKGRQLPYRTDSSNAEEKYTRNFIRHRILPELRKLNPSLEATLGESMQRLKESAWLMNRQVAQIGNTARTHKEGRVIYKLSALQPYWSALPTLLFELLSPYGLNSAQVNDLAAAVQEGRAGRVFPTATHEISTSAAGLEVASLTREAPVPVQIEQGQREVVFPDGVLQFEHHRSSGPAFSADTHIACFDVEALVFPLILRKWVPGDAFQPFGMDGQHQKLQDYFSNNKFSRAQKAATWILVDAHGRIAWVVGHRSSHWHRVRQSSKAYWRIVYREAAK